MAGIRIPFIADVADFFRGTKKVSEALEDVVDSIDDVSREANRTTDKVGDDFTDAGREIERSMDEAARETESATEKIERSFRESMDSVKKESKEAGDRVDRDLKGSMDKGANYTGEFKAEATQNIAETASSFDGSMDSIADMVQSTFGGLATLPGVGIGVAALGALGGLVYADWQRQTEATKQAVADMFADMLESGNNYRTQEQVASALQALYEDEGKFNAVKAAAEDLGLTVEQVATAYVTAGGARDAVMAKAAEAIATEQAAIAALRDEAIGASRAQQEAIGHEIIARQATVDGYQSVIDMIEGQADATDTAAAKAQSYREAVALAQANVRAEYGTTAETQARTTQQAIDDMARLGSAVSGTPRTIPVQVDLTAAERAIRNWRPVITGVVRAGQAVV